ncbi:MAG: alanine--glyoxylate aminotransferase family protein [Proteobacteria bacterium]|nr:alanine--glyoxylate aminotransferase family protein [Pseudomonadota bacterium]
MRKRLFIPGPVDVREEVLKNMGTQMISHRGKEASALQKRMHDKIQQVFHTKNLIVFSTSSGSGLMESSIKCCTAKRVAVFSVGSFGDRWANMGVSNGVPTDCFTVANPGDATTPDAVDKALATGKYDVVTITHNETSSGVMNPLGEISKVVKKYPDVLLLVDAVSSMGGTYLPVDEWGIDVCITSTQKCLGLPPGLSIASVSEKAYNRAKTVKNRGYYLDLVQLYDFVVKKDHQYHATPSLAHYFALDAQLDYILNVEGLENRYKRHEQMAKCVRDWANKNFEVLPAPEYRSNTLTVIKNTKNINVGDLNKFLAEKGFLIANGYGDLKDKTFRIAHMADTTMETVKELLGCIDEFLKKN